MLKKQMNKVSLILVLTLVLQVFNPIVSFATSKNKEIFGETVLFTFDGYTYTSVENEDIGMIRTYKDNNTLVEEIILNKNTGHATKLDYISMNGSEPTKTIINLETSSLGRYNDIEKNNTGRSSRLGSATFRVDNWTSNYAVMDVYYQETIKKTTHQVRSFTGTVGEIILYLATLLLIPQLVAGNLIRQLIADGLILVAENTIVRAVFALNAVKTIRRYTGTDRSNNNYTGIIEGTETEIHETDHPRIGEISYEGIHLYPQEWGNLSISYALYPSVYRGLHGQMRLLSEGY